MKLHIPRTPEDDAGGPVLNIGQAIEEFFREFPERRKDTFILDHQKFSSGQEAVDSLAEGLRQLQTEFPGLKTRLSKSMALGAFEAKMPMSVSLTESTFDNKPDMAVLGRIVIPAGEQFTARVLKSVFIMSFPPIPEAFNDTKMWQQYVLDHELGHALTMMGIHKQDMKTISIMNRAECEADAYSMIRHYQRFGDDTGFVEYIRDIRNMNVVHGGDVTHWTSAALDQVILLHEQGALKDLTPAQSRDLAVKIAGSTALSADAENNAGDAFGQVHKILRRFSKKPGLTKEGLLSIIETVSDIGINTASPAALDICKRYLAHIPSHVPADDWTPQDMDLLQDISRKLAARQLGTEPPMTGLKRAFRDAMVDVQSGVTNDNKPSKKPPFIRRPPSP